LVAKQHVEGIWQFSDGQAESFGVLLRDLAKRLRNAVAAERVYLVSFGESYPHFHALLITRSEADIDGARGLALVGAHLAKSEATDHSLAAVAQTMRQGSTRDDTGSAVVVVTPLPAKDAPCSSSSNGNTERN
jgi:hypothetical protein